MHTFTQSTQITPIHISQCTVSVPMQRNMRTYIYTDYAYIHTEYTDYTDKHITMRTYIHIGDTYTQTSHA